MFCCPALNSSTLIGSDELPRMFMSGRLLGFEPLRLSMAKFIDASAFFSVCSRFCPRNCFSCSAVTVATEPV